jgi:hypothetical protein
MPAHTQEKMKVPVPATAYTPLPTNTAEQEQQAHLDEPLHYCCKKDYMLQSTTLH